MKYFINQLYSLDLMTWENGWNTKNKNKKILNCILIEMLCLCCIYIHVK